MSYRVAPFTFDFDNSRINVDSAGGVADVSCIDLYNAIKEARASAEGILYDIIALGSGLIELQPGITTALNVQLTNNWRILFPEDGEYQVAISGGNLTGGKNDNPIEYTPNVQVKLILANSSTVVATGSAVMPQDIVDIKDAVLNGTVESTWSLKKMLRIIFAVLAGKSSGSSVREIAFRDIEDTKDRVIGSTTEDGDREEVILDGE